MSAFGGKADAIGTKADMPVRMSAVRGKADVACQGLSGPFIANSGHSIILLGYAIAIRSD